MAKETTHILVSIETWEKIKDYQKNLRKRFNKVPSMDEVIKYLIKIETREIEK